MKNERRRKFCGAFFLHWSMMEIEEHGPFDFSQGKQGCECDNRGAACLGRQALQEKEAGAT